MKVELFKASDVCELAQLQPYVLRSWEAEFPTLGQTPASGGPRVYRRADLVLVLRLKQLVFGEGLTLAGARRRLEEEDPEPSVAAAAVEYVLGDMARTRLRSVRHGLEAIMQLLSRDEAHTGPPELQLVAPSAEVQPKSRTSAAPKRTSAPARPAASAAKKTVTKRRQAS